MKKGEGNFMAPYAYYLHTFGEPEHLLKTDKDPDFLAQECVKKGVAPKMFLSCGSEDFLFENNSAFHAYLEKIGYSYNFV